MDVNEVNKRESPQKGIARSKGGRVGDIECRAAASPCSEAHPEILNMKNYGDTSTGKYHGKDTKRGQKRVEFGTKQSQVAASPHRWLPEDEISLCNVLLDLVKSGKEMNPNMSRVQRSLKGSLKHDYSKSQLYEKIRRMKTKFLRIKGNLGGKNKDGLAPGMGTHEKNLYSIWKQIWTENEQPQPEMHNIGDDGTDEKNKHGDGSEAKGRSDKQPSEMDVKVPAVAIGRAAASTPRFLKGLVERNAGGIGCFRFPGYGEIFTSYRRGLNDHHVRNGPLEQKWRELHRCEVKAFHQRLKLLKEECNYRLQLLKQEKKD